MLTKVRGILQTLTDDSLTLAVDCGQKSHEPWDQSAGHRSALYIEDGVERDRLAQLRLELPARVLGNQDFNLEGVDREGQ